MFPVTDFNLVVCGIATFAATVGYACTRRLAADPLAITNNSPDLLPSIIIPPARPAKTARGTNPPDDPTGQPADSISEPPRIIESPQEMTASVSVTSATVSRKSSLKRKRPSEDQEDANADTGYPHNLASIYPPKKRSRTPSSENDNEETMVVEEDIIITSVEKDPESRENLIQAQPVLPPATPERSIPKVNDGPQTPSPVSKSTVTVSPTPKTPLSRVKTSNAFSAFAGSTSPFAAVNKSPNLSSNFSKPAWVTVDKDASNHLNQEASRGVLDGQTTQVKEASEKPKHVLAAAENPKPTTVEHLTGEEDEDVELELKGVKLYVKQGEQPFSEGIVGHIKLLSNKTTLDERLLFRREPLWKVSMNIRMRPSVRCTFDAEENVLRLIRKEFAEKGEASQADHEGAVVVYALKPGRACSKQDFKDFAKSLMETPGLKPR